MANNEDRNSRRALRLSFVYIGAGFLALLLGICILLAPVSSFEERLIDNERLPIYLILRTLGFIGAISMAGWCVRMHNLAINRHWHCEEKASEAHRFLGDVLSLRDSGRSGDVRDRLKDHRAECARIKMEHMVESPEISNRFIDKLFDLANGIVGRRKK